MKYLQENKLLTGKQTREKFYFKNFNKYFKDINSTLLINDNCQLLKEEPYKGYEVIAEGFIKIEGIVEEFDTKINETIFDFYFKFI